MAASSGGADPRMIIALAFSELAENSGKIGELKAVQVFFCYNNQDPNNIRNIPETGGGAILDIGGYGILSGRFTFETEPKRIVSLIDRNLDRLRELDDIFSGRVYTLASNSYTIGKATAHADLVIGGVLIPGASAPKLVTKKMVSEMKPGSVIVDVAIDQGGCIATSRPTSHSNPTYIVHDVVHYCVTNMPGAVGRTSTYALCNVTLPWAIQIAERGIDRAARELRPVARAINTHASEVTNKAVADTFGLPYSSRFSDQSDRK